MTEEARASIISLIVTAVFGAGGFYAWVRLKMREVEKSVAEHFEIARTDTVTRFQQCMADIDGIAARDRDNARNERRHYHNTTMAILVAAPPEKETEITKLLKEEGDEK